MIDSSMLNYTFDEEALGFEEPPMAEPETIPPLAKLGVAMVALGILFFLLSLTGMGLGSWGMFLAVFAPLSLGAVLTFWAKYKDTPQGIKHNGVQFSKTMARGWIGWGLGILFTGFYVALYFYPENLSRAIQLTDPLSRALAGEPASQWFLYGLLYTLSVIVFGFRMLMKYRHNRYHRIRTLSVTFFQLGFAFLIPNFLKALNQPEFYFTYFWPLKYDYLFPNTWTFLTDAGALGTFMVFWGAMATFIATPVLTYFYGKRWYCSWVCGCGGLAETLGDPWRQLSSKSMTSWRLERWLIHSVLILIVALTALLWINQTNGGGVFGSFTAEFNKGYGFFIGSVFSGVIGVGFYPVLGSRVWCRFGCPMAAVLGILQRFFSRFRITTNGDQCMSCGNCSTYCEMGIDVRAYAQSGENIIRASCVGCGVCAAVCPRGVLKLEGGDVGNRYSGADEPLKAMVESLKDPKIYR